MNTNIFLHLLQDLSSFFMILHYWETLDIFNYEFNVFLKPKINLKIAIFL